MAIRGRRCARCKATAISPCAWNPEKTAELEDERQTLIGQDYTFADGDEIAAFAEINDRSLRCAQIIIATIPIVCSDPFLRRYFVKGIIVGSVKG